MPYTFTNALLQHLRESTTTEEEKRQIKDGLDFYLENWTSLPPGQHAALAAVGRTMLRLADSMIRKGKKAQGMKEVITCREGCAHCCRQAVGLSLPEAAVLVEAVRARQIPIDRAKLTRQATLTDSDDWTRLPADERACVFLGTDNRCQVYDERPLACRKYFSIGPPELCNIDAHPGGEVQIWFDMNAEILSTANMTHWGSETLPRLLLELLPTKEVPNGEADQC